MTRPQTLAKVRPGDKLRIPAFAYNTFVDAAKFVRAHLFDQLDPLGKVSHGFWARLDSVYDAGSSDSGSACSKTKYGFTQLFSHLEDGCQAWTELTDSLVSDGSRFPAFEANNLEVELDTIVWMMPADTRDHFIFHCPVASAIACTALIPWFQLDCVGGILYKSFQYIELTNGCFVDILGPYYSIAVGGCQTFNCDPCADDGSGIVVTPDTCCCADINMEVDFGGAIGDHATPCCVSVADCACADIQPTYCLGYRPTAPGGAQAPACVWGAAICEGGAWGGTEAEITAYADEDCHITVVVHLPWCGGGFGSTTVYESAEPWDCSSELQLTKTLEYCQGLGIGIGGGGIENGVAMCQFPETITIRPC